MQIQVDSGLCQPMRSRYYSRSYDNQHLQSSYLVVHSHKPRVEGTLFFLPNVITFLFVFLLYHINKLLQSLRKDWQYLTWIKNTTHCNSDTHEISPPVMMSIISVNWSSIIKWPLNTRPSRLAISPPKVPNDCLLMANWAINCIDQQTSLSTLLVMFCKKWKHIQLWPRVLRMQHTTKMKVKNCLCWRVNSIVIWCILRSTPGKSRKSETDSRIYKTDKKKPIEPINVNRALIF